MKLEDIGFYTLSDLRAKNTSPSSRLWRCELILTSKCNFQCPYCRGIKLEYQGDIDFNQAKNIISLWSSQGLKNIRFSGGEPCLYEGLPELVKFTKNLGIERIALSTNGSFSLSYYQKLIKAGVNDFSISLDACCSETGKLMSGNNGNYYKNIINNIKKLSKETYVTVGVVLTDNNLRELSKIVILSHNMGVDDIRIISASQKDRILKFDINDEICNAHPILKFRVNNFKTNKSVRGIKESDCHRCYLMLDDMAVIQNYHFPCIIYFRERGLPIGTINKQVRKERYKWFMENNTFENLICKNNCLDVCVAYNNKAMEINKFGGKHESYNTR